MPRKKLSNVRHMEVPDIDYAETLKHVFGEEGVNHPVHYSWLKEACGVEPIEILRHMDFDLGNAVKYLLRCGRKGVLEDGSTDVEKAIQDLEKAKWYIDDKIDMLLNTNK